MTLSAVPVSLSQANLFVARHHRHHEPVSRAMVSISSAAPITSTRAWRNSRIGAAPSAVRIAISRCRRVARASKRLPTFAHAISSTQPAADSRITNDVRVSPSTWSLSGTTVMPTRALLAGNSLA